MHIYLASASPRRHELLNQIHVSHDVLNVPAPEGEDEPILPGEDPLDYVIRTAKDKNILAQAYLKQTELPIHPILTADTTVVYQQTILGKPIHEQDAKETLQLLSGKWHDVRTAVVLSYQDILLESICTSQVLFKPLSEQEIQDYIDSKEGFGKAGSYAVQGRAATFIKEIKGSYSGIMGLPLYETHQLLMELSSFIKT
ncbi:Maf family protein [Basilea psittacipulmonis]|nr:Maf family protein [Basilea psittacipulmonis]